METPGNHAMKVKLRIQVVIKQGLLQVDPRHHHRIMHPKNHLMTGEDLIQQILKMVATVETTQEQEETVDAAVDNQEAVAPTMVNQSTFPNATETTTTAANLKIVGTTATATKNQKIKWTTKQDSWKRTAKIMTIAKVKRAMPAI